jgi:hypothetical protein
VSQLDGWQIDTFGRHEGRYFTGGQPTNRVRDGNQFSYDALPAGTASGKGGLAVVPNPTSDNGLSGVAESLGPEAGWYPDPSTPGAMRYWDGSQWTNQVVPPPPPPAPDAPPAPPPPAAAPPLPPEAAPERVPPGPVRSVDERPIMTVETVEAQTRAAEPAKEAIAVAEPESATRTTSGGTPPPSSTLAGPGLFDQRGPHYVVVPDAARSDRAQERVSIVTGEVPPGYSRVTVECEHGDVVEATILSPRTEAGVHFFAVPVCHRVLRIMATKQGGVYGIFLDVGLLERDGKHG